MSEEKTTSDTLVISEIYQSVQGEAAFAGWPCTFIRLTGCPLRCRWCDTVYSFKGGEVMALDAIIDEIKSIGVPLIELTGGEPLAQANCPELIRRLIAEGFRVMIETSGSEPVAPLPKETHIIMDLKCPDSGMHERNLYENLDHLKPSDEIKFVIASRSDFEWARDQVKTHRLDERFQVLFSPAFVQMPAKDLVAWMLEEKLVHVRLNLQQHKYIWSPRAKGV